MRPSLRSLVAWCCLSGLVFWGAADSAEAKEYWLFYLGGQSNMDGFGYTKDLPESLRQPVSETYVFHGTQGLDGQPLAGQGIWAPLRPGHGTGFHSDGKVNHYSDRFGVELSFAAKLRELYPDQPFAFIKYSRGGTSIDQRAAGNFGCWEPDFVGGEGVVAGINQYDHCLATMRNALQCPDIDSDGEADRLIPMGMLWMQGESDAMYGDEVAKAYSSNLKRLMDLLRASLRVDDLPVAIGRISDSGKATGQLVWAQGEIVRAAQADFVAKDPAAVLVTSTDAYGYSDPWHYDSAGYLDLGKQFAEQLSSILQK